MIFEKNIQKKIIFPRGDFLNRTSSEHYIYVESGLEKKICTLEKIFYLAFEFENRYDNKDFLMEDFFVKELTRLKIAVDAMGGDFAPKEVVLGAVQAARIHDCEIVLVGDKPQIEEILAAEENVDSLKISIRHTTEKIEMGEHPADAVRTKKDSSIVVATQMVKDGECDCVFSAGSTGAAVAAAVLILKRIKGIGRPSIATPIPTINGVTLLLDSGANVDSKPEHLVESGIMGSLYSQHVFGKENPRVGLLNIGEEETKGNEQAKETYQLLKNTHAINFVGNAEGRDIPSGNFDVVICDGFVGNVVLKFAEGLAKMILNLLKETFEASGLRAKLGAALLMPTLKTISERLDASEYGGAPLLGVDGCCIIGHGSSKAKSICSAIGVANDYVEKDLLNEIRNSITEKSSEIKSSEINSKKHCDKKSENDCDKKSEHVNEENSESKPDEKLESNHEKNSEITS